MSKLKKKNEQLEYLEPVPIPDLPEHDRTGSSVIGTLLLFLAILLGTLAFSGKKHVDETVTS